MRIGQIGALDVQILRMQRISSLVLKKIYQTVCAHLSFYEPDIFPKQ